jgi:hypothetical protein
MIQNKGRSQRQSDGCDCVATPRQKKPTVDVRILGHTVLYKSKLSLVAAESYLEQMSLTCESIFSVVKTV